MQWVVVFVATYFFVLSVVTLSQIIGNLRLRTALVDTNHRVRSSMAWAWASEKTILAAQRKYGPNVFGDILTFPIPKLSRLFLPWVAPIIFLVITYQFLGSILGKPPLGHCKSTPNCSNFLIGSLSRYSVASALSKTQLRVAECGSTSDTTYSERYW